MRIADVLDRAAELVLGAGCAGCGRPGLGPCADCVAAVDRSPPFVAPGLPDGLPPVFAGGSYAAELRRLLIAAKERHALGVVPLLGRRLAASVAGWALSEGDGGQVALVPVPTARARVAERGLDLTVALARVATGRLRRAGLPASVWCGLRLVRRPADQSELGREGRLANLAGALEASRPPSSARLVVVDDIVTTGATLLEAVRACSAAGRAPVAGATVAATTRRGGGKGRPVTRAPLWAGDP
nr:ComF family protein [Propionicimonas sp.]